MSDKKQSNKYSWSNIIAMAIGLGMFGLFYVSLKDGWIAGLKVTLVIVLAIIVFGAVMRKLADRTG